MKKGIKFILRKLFWGLGRHFLSDKSYTKIRYWLELDEWPDLQNPQKFSEKIQHIKLNDHDESRKKIANRKTVRKFVSEKIGKEYLIPLVGIYDELTSEIWRGLPSQFVLKANHGSGMIHITFDKKEESYTDVYHKTEAWKNFDYAKFSREWAYSELPRTIVVEELLLNSDQSIPKDYKFFCFNGRVELIQVDFDRFQNQKRNLYNRNFNQIDGTLLHPNYKGDVQKPSQLNNAIDIAETLSAEFNFLRVDLYLLDDAIYFGELTNYPGNGFEPFKPEKLDYELGSKLTL